MDHFASTSPSKLEDMLDREKDAATREKLLVLWHKKQGKSEREIGEILKIPKATIGYWFRKFRKEGAKGFQRKPGTGGQNRYLSKEQEAELVKTVNETPMDSKEVLAHITERYGKEFHPNSIPRLMKRLGQSHIVARPRHYKANPRSGRAFKGHIKKIAFVEI